MGLTGLFLISFLVIHVSINATIFAMDDGEMFDINQFSEPKIDNLIHEKRKGGLGIRLVKSIMDDVQYLSRKGRFVCRLSKQVN